MRRLLIAALAALLMLAGACAEKPEGEKHTPTGKAYTVGKDSVDAHFLEQGSNTLAYWLKSGAKNAILVRIAGYDGTEPVKASALDEIKGLAGRADYAALTAAGDMNSDKRLYGSPNAVYVAHSLGIVRELWWVAPTFASVTDEDLEHFKKRLKELYPADAAEINSLKLGEDGASGKINGIPVRLLGLEQLKSPGEPVLLDIDGSFFQVMYRSEKETASLKFVAGLFKLLTQAGLSAQCVSVCAAGDDGMASLRFRSFAKYMVKMLKEPAMIDAKPPELWAERAEAWRAEQKDKKVAVPIYKNIIARNPDDAMSRYDLSDLYFRLGRIEDCANELEAAVKLDRGYTPAYGMYRDLLAKAGQAELAKRFYARKPAG